MMKLFLTLLVVFCFNFKVLIGQTKNYIDTITGLQLRYPDSLATDMLTNNEDIKEHNRTFVIEIYKKKIATHIGKQAIYDNDMNPIEDNCYKLTGNYFTESGLQFDEYLCNEYATGEYNYFFIYVLEKSRAVILLKFIHEHCIRCKDENGKHRAFNKDKDIRWITDILESATFKK